MTQTIQRTKIPIVRLDGLTALTDGDWMKFIQIQDRETDRMYLRADPHSGYHRDILQKFKEEMTNSLGTYLEGGRIFCPGGGRIRRDQARHEIEIYGHSGDFGKYDIARVKAIATPYLRRKLPGWTARFE